MTDPSLTLHIDARAVSPWAMTAFVALEEKGLGYSLKTQRLGHPFEAFAGRTRRIPALNQGDFWLTESLAIAEFLAETYPAPAYPRLFPEDLRHRATARELMLWLRTDFLSLRKERSTETLWGPRATAPLSEAAQADAQKLIAGVAPLLSGRPTLFEHWCLADVELALVLQRLALNADPLPERLASYAAENWKRPSLLKWHALART